MRRAYTLVVLSFLMVVFSKEVNAKEKKWRDPFVPLIKREQPVESTPSEGNKDIPPSKGVETKPELDITIEGIIIGPEFNQAIINGDIYRKGEMLKNNEVKVIDIKKDKVILLFKGWVYEKKIKE